MPKVKKSKDEWKSQLSPLEYKVTRKKGTEPAFTGEYWDTKTAGVYCCLCCGSELFGSDAKYDSGTGWPSFWQPLAEDKIENQEDRTLFMRRTEVVCVECHAHLGHVFPDGPAPTGLRYCLNSASLKLDEKSDEKT